MNANDFAVKRPFLYHLTDRRNLPFILRSDCLISAEKIVNSATKDKEAAKKFLRNKRTGHEIIKVGKIEYRIRDQRPISIKVLEKSLSNGLKSGDFLEILNERVFWWPTVDRLTRHYIRYENERPIILRVNTIDLIDANPNAEFCSLNSGATRCHPAYKGSAPTRGKDTFQRAATYASGINSVAEVTFVGKCILPVDVWIGARPQGPWKKIK